MSRPVPAPPPVEDRVFATADAEQAHDYICRTYTRTTMRPVGDQARLRMRDRQIHLSGLTVADFAQSSGSEHIGEPLNRLLVARVLAGRWRADTIGEQRLQQRGDLCVVAQPDRPYVGRWDGPVRLQMIAIDPVTLLDVAADGTGLVPRLTALTPASDADRERIAGVLDHVVHDVVDNPSARHYPLVQRNAVRLLAATLLSVLPSTATVDPAGRDQVDAARSRVLRAAIAYVHDHAHADITVAHLAEAAGVSRQAVHLAFRQHLQSTPQAYLGRVRLDRAHRDLTDLDPAWTTVEHVARLWGFSRLDRFRAEYRRAYGRSPEQTLGG